MVLRCKCKLPNLEKIWQRKKSQSYSKISTRSIPSHTQEPKHSATTIVATGTELLFQLLYGQTLHNPAPPTLTLLTIHNPSPDLPAPPICTVQRSQRRIYWTVSRSGRDHICTLQVVPRSLQKLWYLQTKRAQNACSIQADMKIQVFPGKHALDCGGLCIFSITFLAPPPPPLPPPSPAVKAETLYFELEGWSPPRRINTSNRFLSLAYSALIRLALKYSN